jgi:hypothetical protein
MAVSRAIAAASRGETGKPFSARAIAGANSRAHGRRPWRRCISASSATVPGTPTDLPPTTAAKNSIGLPSGPRKRSGRAAAGAVSRPS